MYLARDLLDDGREVALKVCHLSAPSLDLLNEFRVLRDLRHPGIARAFDFGKLPRSNSAYFTLEYVAGPDLEKEAALLRRKRPDALRSLIDISIQIASALEYLHRRGLLHLDLKPANVVLSGGRAKLIDFGLFQNAALRAASLPRGTAYFTAPEVFDGRSVDRRTDLYSLGVTLYRAFTGKYPIQGRTLAEIAEAHRRTPPSPPAGVPHELGRIILKLVAKSPEHRFQGAAEVSRALREILGDGSAQRSLAEEPDLTGRNEALDAFFSWFDAMRKGSPPRLLIVEGETGAGKSRFAEACVTEMLGLGARVISLGSFGGKDAPTLEKLVEKALVIQPATSVERKRRRFLFTSLGIQADSRSRSEIIDLDLEQIRGRTYHETVDFLEERAAPPLVFVLDDADSADARLLDFLQRWGNDPWLAERSLAVGIVATSRPGSGLVRNVGGPGGRAVQRIRLGRLSQGNVVRAIRSMDPEIDRPTAARIARRCRGNPGLVVQCVQLGEQGTLSRSGAEAMDRQRRVHEEIRSLEEGARSLLLHMLLLARPADEAFLRRITGLAAPALRTARLRLEKAALLRGSPRGWYVARRAHEDAAEREFPAEEIRAAHERIGLRFLEEPAHHGDAARHLLAAGKAEEGLRAAEEAGRELRAEGKVEEALSLFSDALPSARGATRSRILEEIGGLEEKGGRFDEAAKQYEEILAESDLPADGRLRVLRKLGGVELRRGVNAAAERAFETALELLEGVDAIEEHLHLLNEISALYLFRGEYSRAANFANRGLELLSSPAARGLSREARAFHALNLHSSAGHIFLRQFEYDRATEEFLRGLRFAEEIGSLSNAALILNNLGIAYHQSNRLRKALQVYSRASSITRRLGDDTTLFSILCNVATIRARMGEVQAADETLKEIEEMPPARRSSRARLFFLHSRGLVEKLALRDSRSTFEESVRLAEELPDPLFARYGRMLLFENEIHQGRWASARKVLAGLEGVAGKDLRLDRALTVRRAYLEALCGRSEEARGLLGSRSAPGAETHYADLWDRVHHAATLIEVGSLPEAEAVLEATKRSFDKSSQPPGSLECALLLAEIKLRERDRDGAALHIKEARRVLSLHDTSRGSRGARVWIPFLEARAALLAERASRSHVADRLEDAVGNLSHGATAEISWLIDLVAAAGGEHGAARRLASSRRRFVSLLAPTDRKRYLARDHRARLGLTGGGASAGAAAASRRAESAESVRYEALLRLRHAQDPRQALEIVLAAARTPRGAVFLDGDPPIAAIRGLKGGKKALSDLRLAVLRARSGRAGRGLCASLHPSVRARSGVLYVEPADETPDADLPGFLDVAAQVLGSVLSTQRSGTVKPSVTTPALLQESVQTRTFETADLGVGSSPRMQEIVTLVHRTRDSRLPILITGESGAGKDHLARWIHSLSPRGKGPFVAQDCSAIPHGLIEAEIFGFEAGAFSGADRSRTGYLFTAMGGTFYLDNVDSLPLEIQVKLLRVLEEEAARPLGGGKPRKADVRFMASSQRDLKDLSAAGEFRKDLFFRLAGITINVPPLRERAEDIPLLVQHFQRQLPGASPAFTPAAMEAMKAYSWPGNVRELESVVRRLALATEGTVDEIRVAKVLGLDGSLPSFPRWFFEGRDYHQAIDEVKREYLLHLFEQFEGNVDRIARELGTTKRNVYLRFSQAGIRPVDLRQGPG